MQTNTDSPDQPVIPLHPMPFVRVELVVMSVAQGQLQVLLSRRAAAPHKGKWGLPGGVLRIDLDKSLEAAARRVGLERLNRSLGDFKQVLAVGGAQRDERAPWALSVIYRCWVRPDLQTEPGKRVEALAWHAVDALPSGRMAFDHDQLIDLAVAGARQEVRSLDLSSAWLPELFTVPELQADCETVLGTALDKVTFRRRLEVAGVIEPLAGQMRVTGAHRPSQVYRLRK